MALVAEVPLLLRAVSPPAPWWFLEGDDYVAGGRAATRLLLAVTRDGARLSVGRHHGRGRQTAELIAFG